MSEYEVLGDDASRRPRDEAGELARRAAARDSAAWSEVFALHYRSVFAFIRYRLSGAAEAEDLASQVFEVAYSRCHRFDYRGLPIEAWLIGIARNLVRDHIKKLARRGPTEEVMESVADTGRDEIPSVDLRRDLAQAMRVLTEDQQAVLSLRFLLDKSVADTARLMKRSEDAVKNLQRRALASLRRGLEEGGVSL